jgi:hypothetical protein
MADDKPKTTKVIAHQAHTAFGESYEIGDTYDAPDDIVDSLRVQGKATPVDPAASAKKAEKAAKPAKAAKGKRGTKRSTAVAPMGTTGASGRALVKPRKAKK